MISIALIITLAFSYLYPLALPPIASFHFEWMAFLAWSVVLATLPRFKRNPSSHSSMWLLLAIFCLPAGSMLLQMAFGSGAHWQLSLIGVWFLVVAAAVAWAGWALGNRSSATARGFKAGLASVLVTALVVAAVGNAMVGAAQYFQLGLPKWLVFPLADAGRVYGNLRQPNQFALFIVWGMLALLALDAGVWRPAVSQALIWRLKRHRALALWTLAVRGKVIAALLFFLALATAMSGSRTGALLIWLMAVCVCLLPGVRKRTRWLAVAAVVAHFLAWQIMAHLDALNILPFYSSNRGLASTASMSDARLLLWADVITLIQLYPIAGIGFQMLNHELNINNLMGLPNTINAHNLFLQVAVEHGLIFLAIWTALILVLGYRILKHGRSPQYSFMLLGVGAAFIHSQLEFPLWYAHFLLPFAFVLGVLASASENTDSPPFLSNSVKSNFLTNQSPSWQLSLIFAILMVSVSIWAFFDYRKVTPIYTSSTTNHLTDRLVAGYESKLFNYLADYASFTAIPVSKKTAETHYRLGMKITKFDFNEHSSFQLMLAAAYTKRWTEAEVIFLRLQQIDNKNLLLRVNKLDPEARQIYAELVARSK